jgi:membrane protein required for colicin V production
MEVYDFVMLAVLLAATLFGAWKGLVWQLASLGAIIASCFVALKFREPAAAHITATPPWNVFLAMLFLYVGTSLLIWVAFRLVSGFIDRLKLKEFDRQIGALFGFAKGVLLCVIITLFAVTLLGENQRQSIVRSRSGYYIARLLEKSDSVMPPEVRDVLRPYVHSLDERLNDPGVGQAADESSPQRSVDESRQAWDQPAPAPQESPWRR